MSKKPEDELKEYLTIAEILLRITSLEKLLFDKGIITQEELIKVMDEVSSHAAKAMLANSNKNGELGAIIKNIQDKNSQHN
jgi:hypothetical protein